MKKLCEIFNCNQQNGDVGVEIEVEGKNLPVENTKNWLVEQDGSLRGGLEYIFKKPLPLDKVEDALKELQEHFTVNNSKLSFSFRTSVHVHINVQQLTYEQYLNMLYTYFLLEEPFMTFCGKERKGNRFCLRLQDAEGMLGIYNRLFRADYRHLYDIPPNSVRYSAMNIEATPKYGSLEFRGMRGNMDVERITTWATALVRLREFAKSVKTPQDVFNIYISKEPQEFLEIVLGDLAPTFYYYRMNRDIQKSFSLSIDLPHTYSRFIKPVEEKPKKAPVKFNLNKMLLEQNRRAWEGAFMNIPPALENFN